MRPERGSGLFGQHGTMTASYYSTTNSMKTSCSTKRTKKMTTMRICCYSMPTRYSIGQYSRTSLATVVCRNTANSPCNKPLW